MDKTNLHRHLGQLFVVGYEGIDPNSEFLDFVSECQLGGVILFGDNGADPDRMQQALHTLQRQVPPDNQLLVAIDQEGGRVCRLQEKRALIYSAASYAARNDLDGFAADLARSSQYMAGLGINLNLAPVADIFLNRENSCMTGRCYGRRPELVAPFVSRAVEVLRLNKMLCCLKHFPGLGAAAIDPHQAVAVADYDLATWQERERIPFAAGIEAGADLIMTTHLQLPAVDSTIATGSRTIIDRMLRRELAFDGVVITDEMAMLGADVLGDMGERTVAALAAGHDLVLFGQKLKNARQAFDAVADAVAEGRLSAAAVTRSLKRIAGLKRSLLSNEAA